MEIERKFLVNGNTWRKDVRDSASIEQGYLARSKDVTVRVRIRDRKQGTVTIKSRGRGISRDEFEYEVPVADARALLRLCGEARLSKRRHHIQQGELVWEVDEFRGRHKGLVVAEVELTRKNQKVEMPPWIGEEVSEARRYQNAYLALHDAPAKAVRRRAG